MIYGFIGTGHMGSALATAVSKKVPGHEIWLCNRTPRKARQLSEQLGALVKENREAAARADFLFLGVKPQMMAGMLDDLRPTLQAREVPCTLVTMAAGLTMAAIRQMAGVDFPIIRLMPNTPAAIGQGMVLCCQEGVSEAELEIFKEVMSGAGILDFIDEGQIDAASAIAGCGPAYAALFIEALADGGVACGLPRARAQLYAEQMLLGTAALALETGQHPGQLKDAVCSPAGSTIQGVRALEAAGFRASVFEAVVAAYERTLEMGKR